MKSNPILATGLALMAFAQLAKADVTLRITGSSAFRAASVNAIKNAMTFTGAGQGYGHNGTDFNSATFHYFKGTMAAAPTAGIVTVKTNWTGSVQGMLDVTAGNSIAFIADTPAGLTPGTPLTGLSSTASEGVPDVTTADNLQNSTVYQSPVLTSIQIGIVPFALVAGKDTLPGVTNITNQTFKALYGKGRLVSSLFTNSSTDTQYIYATGRDPFSGTRLTTLAETGHGVQNVVKQYKVISFSSGNTINHINLFPANAVTGVTDVGNDGVSGSKVAEYLRSTTTSVTDDLRSATIPMSFIGYLGETDAYYAVFGAAFNAAPISGLDQGNARFLSFNGVSAFGGTAKKPASVTVANGSPILTGLPAGTTTGLIVGQVVSGDNIPAGSTILALDTPSANTITIDKSPTTGGTTTNAVIGALLPKVIRNGSYTFWNYENMLYKSTVVTSANFKLPVATAIKNRIVNNDYGFSGLANDTDMHGQRDDDGSYVFEQ